MKAFRKNVKFLFALSVVFAIIIACGNKKETTVTKEETKKEETKIDQNNEPTTSSSSGANQLYFVESYANGEEFGKSEKFYIKKKGGYITAMLKTAQPVGVGSVDVRLERESLDGRQIVDTQPYDVSPDKNYFFFDKITFYNSGDYKVTVFKKDGTPIASGNVRIDFE